MTTQYLKTVGKGVEIRINHDANEVWIGGVIQQGDFDELVTQVHNRLEQGCLYKASEEGL